MNPVKRVWHNLREPGDKSFWELPWYQQLFGLVVLIGVCYLIGRYL